MDSQKRLLLALALSFAVTTVYVLFFAPQPDAHAAVARADAGGVEVARSSIDAGVPVAAAQMASSPTQEAPARELPVARASSQYVFSTVGGGLISDVLEGLKTREQQQVGLKEGWERLLGKKATVPPQMNLAVPTVLAPIPLAVSIDGAGPLSPQTHYAVEEQGDRRLVLHARTADWDVKKTLEWPEHGYEMLYRLEVKNISSVNRVGELRVYYSRAIDPKGEEAPSTFGGVGNQANAICRVDEKLHKRAPSSKPPEDYSGAVQFFGVDHQYFSSVLFPIGPSPLARCVLDATPTERVASAAYALTLAPGASFDQRFGAYLGPKNIDILSAVPTAGMLALEHAAGVANPGDPELERTVDFGIWAVICKVLLVMLNIFHGWVRNWGLAIILLTLTVKLALLPVTHRSMKAMEATKKLQPQMAAINKKYAADKERQQLEIRKLYEQAKVNPFGGCLLMVVQMPVWIALYTTLRTSYELYGEAFLSPVWTDLTYKDPTYLLPVLLGITMFVTSKLQPQAADPVQARMFTYAMPVFFAYMLLNTPAGLTLYMVTNNVLSIVQTYVLRKWMAGQPPAAAAV